MKRILVLALLAVPASAQDEASRLEERMRELKALVAALDSADAEKRDDAAAKLLAAGHEAIPYVTDEIHRKGARLQLALLHKLIAQENDALPAELRLSDEDLRAVVKLRATDPEVRDKGRLYLYAKYLEAVDDYRKGYFQSARDKAAAIQTLERRVDFEQDLVKLKKLAEEQIVQTWLVRVSVLPDKVLHQCGDMARVSLTFTNMSAGEIEVWFGPKDQAENADMRQQVLSTNAVVRAELTRSAHTPDGTFIETREELTVRLGCYSLRLKPGESRRWPVEIDTLGDKDSSVFQKVAVRADVRVVEIDGPGGDREPRNLRFAPCDLKVFPGDLKKAMENPLQDMLTSIDRGDATSLYMYSQLMPEDKRGPAVEALMKILADPKWSREEDRRIVRNCLEALTGESFRTDEEWLKWRDQAAVEPKKH